MKCRNCKRGGDGMPCGCSRPDYPNWERKDIVRMIAHSSHALEQECKAHTERVAELHAKTVHFQMLLDRKPAL